MKGQNLVQNRCLKRFEFAANPHSGYKKFQFLGKNNHPEEVFSDVFMWSKINRAAFRYIHTNPVRAGVVDRASGYIYIQVAFNYTQNRGLVLVEMPSPPIVNPLKKGYHIDVEDW
ncbi:MAG: hypothetical protein ACI9QN_000213 [Arcticibacterium sp.]